MGQDKKDIGSIYRDAFKQHQVADNGDEWTAISYSLRKARFMRFRFTSFNIYYSILLASVFLLSAGLLIHHFFIKTPEIRREEKNNTQEIVTPNDSIIIKNSDDGTQQITPSIQKRISGSTPQSPTTLLQDTTASVPQTVTVKDTIVPAVTTTPAAPPAPKTIKKNTVYVTKQDTVVVYDTLKAKKPKKKSF